MAKFYDLIAARVVLFLATLTFFGGAALLLFGACFLGPFEKVLSFVFGSVGVYIGYHWLGGTLVEMEDC